ncbi:hypothetical protein BGZ68_007483 [Mortierella alpina]|nr:hypothetical protein BGZ68_007483 [Mortierella alpina]
MSSENSIPCAIGIAHLEFQGEISNEDGIYMAISNTHHPPVPEKMPSISDKGSVNADKTRYHILATKTVDRSIQKPDADR